MNPFRRLTDSERTSITEDIESLETRVSLMDREQLDTWEGWSLLSRIDRLRWQLRLDDLLRIF